MEENKENNDEKLTAKVEEHEELIKSDNVNNEDRSKIESNAEPASIKKDDKKK